MVEQLASNPKFVPQESQRDSVEKAAEKPSFDLAFDGREDRAGRQDVKSDNVVSLLQDNKLYVPPLASNSEIRLAASIDGVVAKLPGVEITGRHDRHEGSIDLADAGIESKTVKNISEGQKAVLGAAESNIGKKPWQESEYREYLEDGKVGGGAAVAEMLQKLGYKVHGANPKNIMARLIAQGWTIHGAKDAQAGDVVVGGKLNTNWRKGGTNSDIGVVGKDGTVIHHDPKSTEMTRDKFDQVFSEKEYGQQVWVLRPPEKAPTAGTQAKEAGIKPEDLPTGAQRKDGDIRSEDLPTGAQPKDGDTRTEGRVPRDTTLSFNGKDGDGTSTYWQDYWREFYHNKYKDALKGDNDKAAPAYRSDSKAPAYNDPDLAPDPLGIRKDKGKPYYESDLRPDPMNLRSGEKPVGYNEGYEYRDLWSPGQPLKPRSTLIRAREPERSEPDARERDQRDERDERDRREPGPEPRPDDRREDTRDRPEATGDQPLRGKVIALAAGHGGHDSGAVRNGWQEKDFTLMMTRKVAAELERLGATVKLTRDSDVYVTPEGIKAKFNQFRPDLALAIHADSASADVNGILTLYSKQDSKRLAEVLQETLVKETGAGDRGSKYQTHSWKGKPFQSTAGDAPAVFLELANLGSPADAQKIRDSRYQDSLARAVAKGVTRYLGKSTDYTVRQPEQRDGEYRDRRSDVDDRSPDRAMEGKVYRDRTASIYWSGAGKPTANGEIYRPNTELTAAHRTLPFGTKVRVIDRESGDSVVVTINDDGPHVKGRSIDLSVASARAIGLDRNKGLAKVDLEIVKMGDGKRTFHGRSSFMGPGLRNLERERRRYGNAPVV